MKVQWEKDQRDLAKERKHGLFAAASDTSSGKFVVGGVMPHDWCNKLSLFVITLYRQKCPVEAFKKTWPELWPKSDV